MSQTEYESVFFNIENCNIHWKLKIGNWKLRIFAKKIRVLVLVFLQKIAGKVKNNAEQRNCQYRAHRPPKFIANEN